MSLVGAFKRKCGEGVDSLLSSELAFVKYFAYATHICVIITIAHIASIVVVTTLKSII